MDREWLTTEELGELWDRLLAPFKELLPTMSSVSAQRMARNGRLAESGIAVQRFAGRYAINRLDVLARIHKAAEALALACEEEMGEDEKGSFPT